MQEGIWKDLLLCSACGNLKRQNNTLKFQRVLFLSYPPLAFHRLGLGPRTMWAQLNHSFHPDYFGYSVVFGSPWWWPCQHIQKQDFRFLEWRNLWRPSRDAGRENIIRKPEFCAAPETWGQTCASSAHALMLWNQPGGRQHMPVLEPHLPDLLTHSVAPVSQILGLRALFLVCQIGNNNISFLETAIPISRL